VQRCFAFLSQVLAAKRLSKRPAHDAWSRGELGLRLPSRRNARCTTARLRDYPSERDERSRPAYACALVHIRRQLHLSGLLRPTIPVAAAAVSARTVQLSDAEQLENAIVGQLNAVRHAHGLRSLERSAALSRAADDHVRALALAGQFRHEWPDGRPFKVWIRAYYSVARTHFWSVGENLLWTSGDLDALQAANMYLASPPHRRILLMRSWRQIGIGVVRAQAPAASTRARTSTSPPPTSCRVRKSIRS
jgi:uncharacterized protein YkwD